MINIKVIHFMKLTPDMFALVKAGIKTTELRLYDEKRRLIKSGDTIVFKNTANLDEMVEVTVGAVNWFDSFKSLYEHIDKISMGYGVDEEASYTDMEVYYKPQLQYEYGVVAIEISLCADISAYDELEYSKSVIPV